MPVFSNSMLVAGESGLERQVTWVHIVDIPIAHFEWKRKGVLLLTAGFGLKDSLERQEALVPKLVEEGFAGMVLSTGYYFDETPEVILRAADEAGFPIIETPHDVLFIEVTEAILERIVNQQYFVLQQSNKIHAELTELVLQGGNLSDLATTLSRLLKRSVTIEDPSFFVLADAQFGDIDEARERSITEGRTTPEVAQYLLETGIYTELLEGMEPLHIVPMPELGMTMERFVAPIIVDREIHGYIWIVAGSHPLTELDKLAIGHGATVAALILFKERAVREAEENLRGDFFQQLFKGSWDSSALVEQARRFDYRLDRPHQILLLYGPPKSGGNTRLLSTEVGDWLKTQDARALIVWRGEFLVLVLESEERIFGKDLAEAMVKDLSHPARPVLIGVGEVFYPDGDESVTIQQSYEGGREAVAVGRAMDYQEGVIAFDELGVLHWLYHLPPERRNDNAYLNHIRTLASYDEQRDLELLKTLEVYLDLGGSLIDAAESLFIHRNTMLHRLERIMELCDLDLRDPIQRLNLHVAVKSFRLHRGRNHGS